MTENLSTSYGNYDILDRSAREGISFAPGVTDGIKVNSPRPTGDFKKAADKPMNPATYGGQDLISQFLINILMLLTGMLDPDKQGNDKLVSMISKAFGMEDDAKHTQYRELRSDIQTRGKDAVREDMNYSRFDKGSALEAVRLGEPILGKNIYNSQMLELIGKGESGGNYNIVNSKAQRGIAPPKPITEMTINEVMAWQREETGRQIKNGDKAPSSAVGKYQFIRATLDETRRDMGLTGNEKFDQAMQDKLAMHLLNKSGYEKFMTGRISEEEMVTGVSGKWSSVANLRGESAHKEIGDNAASISVSRTVAAARMDKTILASGKEGGVSAPAATLAEEKTLKTSFTAAHDNVKPEPRPLVLAAAVPEAVPPYRPLVLAPG